MMPAPHPAFDSPSPLDCFALLDDATASGHAPRSRLYTGHAGTLVCREAGRFSEFLQQLQQALQQGRHAVGLFCYELGEAWHGIAARARDECGAPLAQALLFDHCQRLDAEQAAAWLARQDTSDASDGAPAGIANLRASVDQEQFHAALARIRAYLEAGDTYQVNYTYRLRFDAFGPAVKLYRTLRASQPVPYGALIQLPDRRTVLSCSPELFLRHSQGELLAQPMKGTAAAGGTPQQDAARAAALASDPKTRAENLMIVDLLRNDLGRVARSGSVQVPQLFEVSRFGRVLQMTSTVRAQLSEAVTLEQLLHALYPCGSVTGAPKRRTMQIIRELEPDARGLYTGAIGWFEPPDAGTIGDFCLSVPIRTLVLQAASEEGGVRQGEIGVGAGIVHDSDPTQEYAECALKAGFLTDLRHDFSLLETMRIDAGACALLDAHLARLRASAAHFGFACNEADLRARIAQVCTDRAAGVHRLRLALDQDGSCAIDAAPLAPLTQPVTLLLAKQGTRAGDLLLRHKTTARAMYDAAWRAAEAQGAFDMLFCNQRGELTEGARSNLFIKLDGQWRTPPLSAGLLPGVMRAALLADPVWRPIEQTLTLGDLRRAEEIAVCNALRGVLPAQVIWQPPSPIDSLLKMEQP